MKKPKVIHVSGRRWFDKASGNTYHTCRIWADVDCVYVSGITCGCGSQYKATAESWLYENGYLEDIGKKGITFVSDVSDVGRLKDLWGQQQN